MINNLSSMNLHTVVYVYLRCTWGCTASLGPCNMQRLPQPVNDEIFKASSGWMLYLCNVLQLVIHSLYYSPLAEQQLVGYAYKDAFHIAFQFGDKLYTVDEKALWKILPERNISHNGSRKQYHNQHYFCLQHGWFPMILPLVMRFSECILSSGHQKTCRNRQSHKIIP